MMMDISELDIVILCGGLGTRLRSAEPDKPKVLVDVNGVVFLDLVIEQLAKQGVERIVLCTGYKADIIEKYYRENDFGIIIDFSREENPLGTGGALKNAREIISSNPFIVMNGDSICPVRLSSLIEYHDEAQAQATIVTSEVLNAEDFGSISIDEDLNITSFDEKVGGTENLLVNAGVYCFDQKVFEQFPQQEVFSLEKDVFPNLVGKGIYAYLSEDKFLDIGTPERLEKARKKL